MAGPVPEIAEAPALGIGPRVPDPAQKAPAPPPLFGTEQAPAVPLDTHEATPEAGPADTPAWDWTKADLRRGKPEDVPEEHRAEFIRLQKDFKAVQGERDRQNADMLRRERALSEKERRLEAIERRVASIAEKPTTTDVAKVESEADEIEAMLADPNTDPEVRSALELVEKKVNSMLKKMGIEDRLAKVAEALPVLQNMTAKQERDRIGTISAQLTEAQEKYSKEEIDGYTTEILDALGLDANWNRVRAAWTNRATGEPHTITSMYEWLSGKTADAATVARAEDEEIRGEKKKQVVPASPRPTPPASPQLSEAEALRQVKALGYGAG